MTFMANIRKRKAELRQRQNVARAESLGQLRKERLRAEGAAKLVKAERKEKARIKAARQTVREESFLYKAGQEAKKYKKKRQKRMKGRTAPKPTEKIRGPDFSTRRVF